jgi:protein TonB
MVDTTWYGARQLDVQPRTLKPVQPAYPPQARRRGLEGTVKLQLRIDEYGVVQEAAVEEGDPPGVFDAAALDAFRTARFLPAQKNQRPVRALVHVRVVFKLE